MSKKEEDVFIEEWQKLHKEQFGNKIDTESENELRKAFKLKNQLENQNKR